MRNLNFIERLEWEIGNDQPFNVVIRSMIPSVLSKDTLIESLKLLTEKHPLLSSQVICSNGHLEFKHIDAPIDLQHEIVDHKFLTTELQDKLTTEELNKKFLSETTLFRCHCIVTESKSFLLLTLHHAISDGVSGISLLFDLLYLYEMLSENINAVTHHNKPLPELESMLPNHLDIHAVPYRSTTNEPTKKATESQSTIFHTLTFSYDETALLLDQCKQRKITVQGLISSAGCSVLKKHEDTDTTHEIMTHHLVNIRPLLSTTITPQDLACIISQINIPINISDQSTMWDNAHTISHDLHKRLKQGAHFDTLKELHNWISEHPSSQTIQDTVKCKGPLFSLSNLGKLNLPLSLSPQLIPAEIHAFVTAHNLYPEKNTIMAVAHTYNQSLHLTLLGSHPKITGHELTNLASIMKNSILEAIN